jgi:hypothetical protein
VPQRKVYAADPYEFNLCWAKQLLDQNPGLLPSCANPPADRFHTPQDMVRSNIVLLQRYEWMAMAAETHPDVDVFAWVEYTCLKQRGMNEDVLVRFMSLLETKDYDAVSLPGCWPKGPINDSEAHWRFCGSCWVSPARYVRDVYKMVKLVASTRALLTGKLSWDMNTMAYVELLDVLPIRWYAANHDETQFLNY